ncbi:MAG: DUF1836 domain-containing protein [Spirochaetia bacterium]|jgi:hypothetical protein|nr:DUF1836 domain-containing protein [Spirochaetales bacterium]MDX9784008.1 DUF1836 domain-containing protein [Spirochaetia bacterium]
MDTINSGTIGNYFDMFSRKAPAEWEQLPDIGLYMDQVVTYLERQLELFLKAGDENLITPSMINNYAKSKIVPRSEGKKYSQEHIALLLTVFTLKRVLSVQDMGYLVGKIGTASEVEALYGRFRRGMEHSVRETASLVGAVLAEAGSEDTGVDSKTLCDLALDLAVDASVRSYAAETLLAFANPEKEVSEKKAKAKARKEKAAAKKGASKKE